MSDDRPLVRNGWFGYLAPLALLLGLVGYFGPWVAHKAAALVLIGQDLGEFVKFLPDVRAGTVTVRRELFYLPLLAGSLGLTAAASSRRWHYPWFLRWFAVILSIPVALSMLPPAWTPQLMLTAEFRLQALAIAACIAVVLLSPLLRRLPPSALEAASAILAVAAAISPVVQFLRIRPMIDVVYGRPVALGWGLWVSSLGFGLAALVCVASLLAGLRTGQRSD